LHLNKLVTNQVKWINIHKFNQLIDTNKKIHNLNILIFIIKLLIL
jgi:hypothetical protein